MRPVAAKSITEGAPISAPPNSDAMGVKSVAVMLSPCAGANAKQHIGRADPEDCGADEHGAHSGERLEPEVR